MELSAETRGRGRDLVLVHGWGMSSAVWEGLPQDVTLGHRLTLIELPGHGASPFDPGWSCLSDWARACLSAAPAPAVWVGWSLGGLVALEAALMAPRSVSGLVQLTATPRFLRAADWPEAMAEETLDRFRDGLLADPVGTLQRFLALQVRGSDAARVTLRTLRRELAGRQEPDPRALAVGLELLRDSDLRSRVGGLACPTLWLYGERDALVPAGAAARLSALMAGARTRVVDGAAHAPFLSHPAETASEMLSFLWGIQA